MKTLKSILPKAVIIFIIFTMICGVAYTAVVTGVAQLFFSNRANGDIIEIDGRKYGSELLAQQFDDENHMWGRIMNADVSSFKDKDGNRLLYAGPSNKSPASEEYEQMAAERVAKIRDAHPEMADTPIPVDLVTCSGSGLDPGISAAAAEYQIPRLTRTNDRNEAEIREIIDKCTDYKFLGVFGEETVNVLKVNLMIDGIIK